MDKSVINDRCINLDWLEIHVLEPSELNADYFIKSNYYVKSRNFGTPQYKEMFTLYEDEDGRLPLYEIRRNPYSLRTNGGIFDARSCHIRLANRTCYSQDPIADLREFLCNHNYELIGISRIDIAMDILTLDDGTDPGEFLHDYVLEKYYKLHLSKIEPRGSEVIGGNFCAHGTDHQFSRQYNSMKWGAPTSNISVKLYNKTLEMQQVKDKYYIRDAWKAAGLITEEDAKSQAKIRDIHYQLNLIEKNIKKVSFEKQQELRASRIAYNQELQKLKSGLTQVWRVEFSLSSAVKGMIQGDPLDVSRNGHTKMYHFTLSSIETRDRLLFTFLNLCSTYFRFKIPTTTREGKKQRKDRCPDYFPIMPTALQQPFKPVKLTKDTAPSRMDVIIINRLREFIENDVQALRPNEIKGINMIMSYYYYHKRMLELQKVIENLPNQTFFKRYKTPNTMWEEVEMKEKEVMREIDNFVKVNVIRNEMEMEKCGTVVPRLNFQNEQPNDRNFTD